jgi:Concanavalin A-like lectin/glucanases superfamily
VASPFFSRVLALSPTNAWPCDDASGNLADAVGSCTMAVAGGASTYRVAGPSGTDFGMLAGATTSIGATVDAFAVAADAYSIAGWFKLTTTLNSGYPDGFGLVATLSSVYWFSYDGSPHAVFPTSNTFGIFYQGIGAFQPSGAVFTDTTSWHHLAFVANPNSNTIVFYLDGTAYGTGTNLSVTNFTCRPGFGVAAADQGGPIARSAWGLWHRGLSSAEVFGLYAGALGADTLMLRGVGQ